MIVDMEIHPEDWHSRFQSKCKLVLQQLFARKLLPLHAEINFCCLRCALFLLQNICNDIFFYSSIGILQLCDFLL